jgi:hypothetical protein
MRRSQMIELARSGRSRETYGAPRIHVELHGSVGDRHLRGADAGGPVTAHRAGATPIHGKAKQDLHAIYEAGNRKEAEKAFDLFIAEYGAEHGAE